MEALTYRPFAPLTTTDGVGSGSRSDEVAFTVNKVLDGRTLNADEFTFELVDDATGNVIQTVKNAADGTVTFEKVKFSTVGEFTYTIREVASGLTGVTDDTDSDIKVTVTVVDNGGVKQATTTYDRTAFTNTYVAPTTTTTTTTTSEPTTTAATTTTTVEPTTTVATTTTTAEPTTTAPTTTTTTAGTTVAPATTTKTPTAKKGKTLPKTGEESGLVTALIGFALLAAGLAGVFYRKSKKA